jgi:5-methylcytosine-specific restriction endonuclease McrBC regulatory subunit McrC
MEKSLKDILKDGSIKDNQTLEIKQGVVKLNGQQLLLKNTSQKIWDFLNYVNTNFSKSAEVLKSGQLVLFEDGLYEHNVDNSLIELFKIDNQNFKLSTSNLIGFIKKGNDTLTISSRFGDQFLKNIISAAEGFWEVKAESGLNKKEKDLGYSWLLLYLWKVKLKKAFRLGIPKSYSKKINRLSKVKGTLDVVDYFSQSQDGKYNCKYREHSYDSACNQLITKVFKLKKGVGIINDIMNIRNAFELSIGGNKSTLKELFDAKPFTNPFYFEYNFITDLSKRILKNEYGSFGEEKNDQVILFDISMLFEYFIRRTLIRQGFSIESKHNKEFSIPTGGTQKKNWKLIPDIVLTHKGNHFVFDAKYKNFDFKNGVSGDDLFQINSYLGQYGNKKNLKGGGFIYPLREADWDKNGLKETNGVIKDSFQIMGKNQDFFVFFLKIPNEANESFEKKFKKNTEDFIAAFSNKIDNY